MVPGFVVVPTPANLGGAVGPVGTGLGDVVSALETVGETVGCGLALSGMLGMAGLVAGVAGGVGLFPASPSSPGVEVVFSPALRASVGWVGCGAGVDGAWAGTPSGSSPDSIWAGPSGG